MTGDVTITDLLERLRTRRRRKRCPDCGSIVSIRGVGGEYRWTCPDCAALGIGYPTRSAALRDVRRRRG